MWFEGQQGSEESAQQFDGELVRVCSLSETCGELAGREEDQESVSSAQSSRDGRRVSRKGRESEKFEGMLIRVHSLAGPDGESADVDNDHQRLGTWGSMGNGGRRRQ